MSIVAYKAIVSGIVKTFYEIRVEALNRYTGRRVQRKRKGIPSKARAELMYRELWSECKEQRPDGAVVKNWAQLLEKYFDQIQSKIRTAEQPYGYSPQVVRSKASRLRPTNDWGDLHLDLITPNFVSNFLDKMEADGASRMVTNHVQKEVKCVFVFALHSGAIKTNPFAGFKLRKIPKKRKEALTHEEVNFLLKKAKQLNHDYYFIWLLTIALGLRRSELAGLKWIDVDFKQRLIHLRRQKIPNEGIVNLLKDREERIVAIPDYVIPVLQKMKLAGNSDFVIEVNCHKWNSGQQASVLREFCREIGIKEVTHHQLRATHITLALIDGIPLGIVKENVGHAKLSTTDEYFRSAGINMRGQTDALRLEVPGMEPAKIYSLKNAVDPS